VVLGFFGATFIGQLLSKRPSAEWVDIVKRAWGIPPRVDAHAGSNTE
jgi:hypothetical protein